MTGRDQMDWLVGSEVGTLDPEEGPIEGLKVWNSLRIIDPGLDELKDHVQAQGRISLEDRTVHERIHIRFIEGIEETPGICSYQLDQPSDLPADHGLTGVVVAHDRDHPTID